MHSAGLFLCDWCTRARVHSFAGMEQEIEKVVFNADAAAGEFVHSCGKGGVDCRSIFVQRQF